ncbi:putative protein-S-isoprenylcysteine O-methyltransferase [Candida viswanathii]|uniref:Protein-S-isoprenylcysteine O-methyltransferase n=1 Tax=Candida viswanathii TaxID=5486 RepID=A0A367XVF4_9ASCO|nr:putative protein-S-isoprenylcysteine O-methyltransferase [Candida viswanathii]
MHDLLIITSSKYFPLLVYFLFLQIYFIAEYANTYTYQRTSVTSRSFLIYGNRGNWEFWVMQVLTVWEYLSVRFMMRYIPWLSLRWLRGPGLVVSVAGLVVRHLAMKTCGASFSHYLAHTKQPHHRLVTHGVYRHVRHPSYFGFWLFSIGIQLWLSNYINLVIISYILYRFFDIRIGHEERLLLQFYGAEYQQYQQHTYRFLPFIN